MDYFTYYDSPIGKIILFERDGKLTKLLFSDEFKTSSLGDCLQRDTDLLKECKRWLDIYFSKKIPDFNLPLQIDGTEFQKDIYNILLTIPYGETMTYKEVTLILKKKRNIKNMSYQAVGTAIGKNPIPLIIPCHRVIKANQDIGEYHYGRDIKKYLLELEGYFDKV